MGTRSHAFPDGKILFFTKEKIVDNKIVDSDIYQIDASVFRIRLIWDQG